MRDWQDDLASILSVTPDMLDGPNHQEQESRAGEQAYHPELEALGGAEQMPSSLDQWYLLAIGIDPQDAAGQE